MKPEQLAKSGTESGHQRAILCWIAINKEEFPLLDLLYHNANGGSRGDSAKSRAIAGGAMKAEGVKPGVPDLFLPVARGGFHGLYIEMKKPGGKASPEQKEWGCKLIDQGYGWMVIDHWEKAVEALVAYLKLEVK